jgi:hypothetical protein
MICVLLFARFIVVKELISDENLRTLYANHREELETLKRMCIEDERRSNLRFFSVSARSRGVDCVRRTGSTERCQEYARLFAAVKVNRIGYEEDSVWLYVDGWGWAGKGKRKGLMWRAQLLPQQDAESRQRYVHIEDGWYIYEVNPSRSLFSTKTR